MAKSTFQLVDTWHNIKNDHWCPKCARKKANIKLKETLRKKRETKSRKVNK